MSQPVIASQETNGPGNSMEPEHPRFSVLHRTAYAYDAPVTENANSLHLEPRTFPFQKTLSATITVLPPTRMRSYRDLFDNRAHYFEVTRPHERLVIESRCKVVNLPLELPDEARAATLDCYKDQDVRERVWIHQQDSRHVTHDTELWHQAVDLTEGHRSVHDKAEAIRDWIHGNFKYESGSTHISTLVGEAFRGRKGVCQDFTHIMLGMCRAVGIPARYASGYLYNGPADSLVGAQASHAWAEVYLPSVGWVGYDPTNNCLADERFIKIAVGRDYEDVAPVKGVFNGTATCTMDVKVVVTKL